MEKSPIKEILQKQHAFFATGKTLSLEFRIEQLKKLRTAFIKNEEAMLKALRKDLNRSDMEVVIAELLIILKELNFIIKQLPKWMKTYKKPSIFPVLWPGRSEMHYEPYGSVLIISPWNYPFQLSLVPLIGAMCAGNCVILKPSEIAAESEKVLLNLINDNFDPEYMVAIHADPNEMNDILKEKFDYIFFTGGTQVGKIVMTAAAQHLTPTTVELGGKSPCIIDETANLDYAARRIVWGKFMNAGQTCIAPDYLLVQESIKPILVEKLIQVCKRFYGDDPSQSESYTRIINQKHFTRLQKLLSNGKIVYGGQSDPATNYIAPTFIDNVSMQDPIMQEEIFGPLLPIISFKQIPDAIQMIKSLPKPLSLYLFTQNKQHEKCFIRDVSYGNGSINDCLMQAANYHMPFGGVGQSGLGYYHGFYSFETFSHRKSIYRRSFSFDLSFTYPPYSWRKLQLIRKILRI